jgi:hypothetical protein
MSDVADRSDRDLWEYENRVNALHDLDKAVASGDAQAKSDWVDKWGEGLRTRLGARSTRW